MPGIVPEPLPPGKLVYSGLFTSRLGQEVLLTPLAFTSTYFEATRSNCAVFFGCTAADMNYIQEAVDQCGDAWYHPLCLCTSS